MSQPSKDEIFVKLRSYLAREVLDGREAGLDETTPLLEWGVLNSMEVARMAEFIGSEIGVQIPQDALVAENLEDLGKITDLVLAHDTH